MSGPWIKFYPSDWRADPALRMCTIAARGMWMEMLCIMHEAEPRGSLLINGRRVMDRQLASLCGCSEREIKTLIAELEIAGVFSRDDGVIYSRRMRADDERAERDKANGRKGGNPFIKPRVNPPDKAQKPEAREPEAEEPEAKASSPGEPGNGSQWPKDFREQFWAAYPRKVGKSAAIRALEAIRKKGAVTFERLMAGLRAYLATGPEAEFTPHPTTWLHQGRWDDEHAGGGSTPIDLRGKFWAALDTPQWKAWVLHRHGRAPPIDRKGGWLFDSEYPPDHMQAAE